MRRILGAKGSCRTPRCIGSRGGSPSRFRRTIARQEPRPPDLEALLFLGRHRGRFGHLARRRLDRRGRGRGRRNRRSARWRSRLHPHARCRRRRRLGARRVQGHHRRGRRQGRHIGRGGKRRRRACGSRWRCRRRDRRGRQRCDPHRELGHGRAPSEGRIAQADLGRLEQQELTSENNWVGAVLNYKRALDNFKIQIGLPTDERIVLDDQHGIAAVGIRLRRRRSRGSSSS